jgi:hypothetical protein
MLKIDSTGKLLWWEHSNIKRFEAVTTDKERNVYLTGCFYGSGTIGGQTLSNATSGTTSDMFIAKFNPSGTLIWAKNVGGNVSNSFVDGYDIVSAEVEKSVYVTGMTSKTAYFETATLTTEMMNSVFLAKYDSSGTELWARSYDSGKYRSVCSMDISSDGTVALAGSYGYPETLSYTTFYNSEGEQIFNTTYESTTNSKTYGISFNSSGEYFVSGYFNNDIQLADTLLNNPGGNSFIAKFDTSHHVQWLKFFPCAEWQSGIHQYTENSAILSLRIDYPFSFSTGVLEPVFGDAVFMKVNEEIKTSASKNQELVDLRIYPNPAQSTVHIFCKERIQKIEIMNITGSTISIIKVNANETTVDLSELKPGIHFIRVSTSNYKRSIVKIVKE